VQLVRHAFFVALLATFGTRVDAQESQRLSLVFEPGLLTAAAISAPEGATPLTAFYVRAIVIAGRDSSRIKGLLGASALPFGYRGSGVRNQNAPSVFGGVQLSLLPAHKTGGWFSLYVPLLAVYSYRGGRTDNTRLYGTDIAGEATLIVYVGRKLFADLGAPWSRFGAFINMFQNLTPNADATTGERDRFRPDFMYGVSIPLVGTR
jgi:hypothetical protein